MVALPPSIVGHVQADAATSHQLRSVTLMVEEIRGCGTTSCARSHKPIRSVDIGVHQVPVLVQLADRVAAIIQIVRKARR